MWKLQVGRAGLFKERIPAAGNGFGEFWHGYHDRHELGEFPPLANFAGLL
jgi:hypothetical protein